MYTYSQLFLRNFLIALSFCVLVALVGASLLTLQMTGQQAQHQKILLVLDKQQNVENSELFAQQITNLNYYYLINISNREDTVNVNVKQKANFINNLLLPNMK